MMSRADLWWSLSAVLPHCKDHIGVSLDSASMTVWGTDNYTVGIARVDAEGEEPATFVLDATQALHMMRYARPTRKSDETHGVRVLDQGEEVHLGFYDVSDQPAQLLDSAVYPLADVRTSVTPLVHLRNWFARTYDRPVTDEMVYQGPLLTRFDKAVIRGTMDRVRFYPRAYDSRHGVALVTVGDRFMGAISALTYDGVEVPLDWFTGGNKYEQLSIW